MKTIGIILLLLASSCSKSFYDMGEKLNLKEMKSPITNSITIQELEVIHSMMVDGGVNIGLDVLARVAPLDGNPSLDERLHMITTVGGDRNVPHITKLVRPTSGDTLYSANVIDVLQMIALYGTQPTFSPLDLSGNGIIDMVDISIAIQNYGNTAIQAWTNLNVQEVQNIVNTGTNTFSGQISGDITDGVNTYSGTYNCILYTQDQNPITQGLLMWNGLQIGSLYKVYFTGANIQ